MNRKIKKYKGIVKRIENDPEKREEAIKNDIPVLFEIKRHPNLDTGSKLWDDLRTFDSYGRRAVQENNNRIQKYANKHNLDPDITRSVIYAENARGHKLGANKLSDIISISDSPLPMNIQKERWSSLVDKEPDDLYDPDHNVEAATILLRRISDRIEKPDAAKIGSIWNYSGREKTNEFGEYVGKLYKEKP
jgi:hypothetical protein